MCSTYKVFEPYGENRLIRIFEDAKTKKRGEYDALVPLSGGKDSMYILYLAVKVYKLKVLTMTYDNGFLSPLALENIQRAVKKLNVKHIVCQPNHDVLKSVYKSMLLHSGDICGACVIAIKSNIYKVVNAYQIPLILLGDSPLEKDSFLPDTTQDIHRFKYIMKEAGTLSKKEISDFLIYPNLNYFKLSFAKLTGRFAKEVSPLFYIKNPSDKEMGEVITKELDWRDDTTREYSKHFDCIAEPFTNYLRYHIYGYERRICQYSNMVRRGEITRVKAIEMHHTDRIMDKPANYQDIITMLDVTEKDMETVLNIKPLKYEKHVSKVNKLYVKLMKLVCLYIK